LKFVFDTNVLLSAHVSIGMSKQVLDYCMERHQVFLSEFIVSEFLEKAEFKFKWPKDQCAFAALNLRAHVTLVENEPLPKPVCRDREDDAVLATAIAAKCDALVTGDKDLLVLKRHKGFSILSPNEVMAFIGKTKARPNP
jgi:putative PIN family toxin of toxin-antitoxin system